MFPKQGQFFYFVLFLGFMNCLGQSKKQNLTDENPIQIQEEKIDCNYFWPAKQIHVCIKDMPKKECEDLFSSGQFIMEKECYCDTSKKEKNFIKGQNYIQYDCR
ncbi:MAG: hypothetical protein ACK4UJ_01790 [Leptonema sp. (in: bacteria)]